MKFLSRKRVSSCGDIEATAERTTKFNLRATHDRIRLAMPALIVFWSLKEVDGTRDRLPEPFDFFDHAGNAGSLIVGYAVGRAASKVLGLEGAEGNKDISPAKARVIMGATGLAFGVVVNTLVETKWGISNFGAILGTENSTPDIADAAYGAIFATVGATALPKVESVPVAVPQPE